MAVLKGIEGVYRCGAQWAMESGWRKQREHHPEALCRRNICQDVQGMIRGERGIQNCMCTLIAIMLRTVRLDNEERNKQSDTPSFRQGKFSVLFPLF